MPLSQTSHPKSPCAQRGRLPVVLDEADVVGQKVEAKRAQRAQVQLLKIIRRGFDADLKLIVVLQAKWVIAVTPVGGPARRLHVSGAPGLGADGAQKSRRVKGPRAHLHVVGLQDRCIPDPDQYFCSAKIRS